MKSKRNTKKLNQQNRVQSFKRENEPEVRNELEAFRHELESASFYQIQVQFGNVKTVMVNPEYNFTKCEDDNCSILTLMSNDTDEIFEFKIWGGSDDWERDVTEEYTTIGINARKLPSDEDPREKSAYLTLKSVRG